MRLYLIDPKTKSESVSLTLLVITFVAVLVAIGLNIAKLTESTGPVMELFYSVCALYFGRKINIKGNTFSSDQAQEVVTKVEQVTKQGE